VAAKRKFTRIPKTTELLAAGVPTEVIPTYCALADYSNNKTGLCWPKMESIATTLNRSVRTIQRHLHLLKKAGLIEFVERRRHKGRFSSYLYKILFVATTGHWKRVAGRRPIYKGTKQYKNTPYSPPEKSSNWLFSKTRDLQAEEAHKKEQDTNRKEDAKRRQDGYEWLFQ
jgi:DNA-binding transcriptional ArsR family regulator